MTPQALFCPYCPTGLLWAHGGLQSGLWRCAACGRIHVPGAGPPADIVERLENASPPDWWQDARGDEVCTFRLSSVNPPDGSGIPGLDGQELRRQLALAEPRLRDRRTRTRWLERYAAQLVAESRQRRGAA